MTPSAPALDRSDYTTSLADYRERDTEIEGPTKARCFSSQLRYCSVFSRSPPRSCSKNICALSSSKWSKFDVSKAFLSGGTQGDGCSRTSSQLKPANHGWC